MQQRGTLKTNWSPLQQNCLSLHPQDIALNHANVMRAMTAFNEGRMKEGKADQGAFGSESKLSNRDSGHAEAEPAELQGGGEFCSFLENWLSSPDLSSLEANP